MIIRNNDKIIAKNAVLLYVRMAIVMILNLYISRLVLKLLGVEDFGVYNVVGGVVALFSYLNSALTMATQRFLNFEMGKNSTDTLNKVFCMSVNIHLILALIIVMFAESIGLWFLNTHLVIPDSRMMAANWVYQFSILSTVIQIVTMPYSALIMANEQMSVYAYISIIEVFLKLGVILLLSIMTGDYLVKYAFLMLVVVVVTRLLYVFYSMIKYKEGVYRKVWDSSLFKKMFEFTGWNFMGATAGIAMNQGVNIILNIFFGPVVNASRSIAIQVQQAFAQLATNFTTAVNPQIVKSYSAGDKVRMTDLVITSSKFAFLVMAVTSMPFLVKMDFVLKIWLGEVPQDAALFSKLLLVYQLTICLTYSVNMVAQASGNIKLFQMVESITLILIIPIGYLQLRLGMSAASIFVTMILLSSLALFLRLIVLRNIVDFDILRFNRKVLKPILIVGFVFFCIYFLFSRLNMDCSSISMNIVQMFLILLFSCLITYFLGVSKKEKKILRNVVSRFVTKIVK